VPPDLEKADRQALLKEPGHGFDPGTEELEEQVLRQDGQTQQKDYVGELPVGLLEQVADRGLVEGQAEEEHDHQ